MSKNSLTQPRWLMEIPVLHDAHLTPATHAMLATPRPGFENALKVCVIPMIEGVIVFCDDPDQIETFPADLRACLHWAMRGGYEWVRFDPNGDIIRELAWHGRLVA